MIMTRILPVLVAAMLAAPGPALAAGGEATTKDVDFSFEGPFGTYDKYQLQRGFQVYHKVCSSCHGLKYLAFRDLGRADGPAFPAAQIKAIAALYDIPDEDNPGETRTGKPSDLFPANKGAGAPDLTLMAKARAGFHGPAGLMINQFISGTGGPEYIYSILTSYTGKEETVAGRTLYKNKAMPGGNISMAPPLTSDTAEDMEIVYAKFGADGKQKAAEKAKDGPGKGYRPPKPTVDQMAKDVAAFLMWAAEPTATERKQAGFRNLIMIIVLTVLLYYTNKKLWAPVKRKD